MRMWNVDPRLMCREHLLGEHLEMHMFAGAIRKGSSVRGYIENGLVETGNIKGRHDELVTEMERRGYKHNSPLEDPCCEENGFVDGEKNLGELKSRCPECRERNNGNFLLQRA